MAVQSIERRVIGTKEAFIGIDLGTSSVKLSLVDVNRVTRGRATRKYDLKIGKAGAAEQNPNEWFGSVMDGIEESLMDSRSME